MRQLDTENADLDLSSQVTVLTHTPDASNPCLCQGMILLGDGSKDLDGTGGDFEITITIGSQTLEPDPQTVTFSTAIRCTIFTVPFPVPANTAVVIKVLSPNAGDSDVDVTAYLYDVGPLQPTTRGRTLGVESDGHGHADLKQWLGVAPLALASQMVRSQVGGMDSDVLTAEAIAASAGQEIAALVETYIVNDGDATAVMQAIADVIAADWVAGDASPLAIASAVWANAARTLTDKAGFSLAADQSGVTVGTVTTLTNWHASVTDWTDGERLDVLLDSLVAVIVTKLDSMIEEV